MNGDYPYSAKGVARPDVDFDVIAVDLLWNEGYGTPRYAGTTAPSNPSWDDGFEVLLYRLEQEDPKMSDPGAGQDGVLVLPIAVALRRPGSKSARNGVIQARLLVRPTSWPSRLGVRVRVKDGYRWTGGAANEQTIVFHASEGTWVKHHWKADPEVGRIEIEAGPPSPPHRGSIHFEAVVL